MERRTFLQATGGAVATAATVGTATTGLALSTGTVVADHDASQPEAVTIYYDQDYLEAYRPLLDLSYEADQLLIGLFGWVATHDQLDTNVCVYWTSYTKQNALRVGEWLLGGIDGHVGDHEPVQVEVDADTGDVERVRASVYHWIKGETTAASAPMEGTNPRLEVIDPWHQYTAAKPDATVQELPVENLGDKWDAWLANGMEESVLPGASRDPWQMRQESDFWRQGAFGFRSEERLRVDAARSLGIDTVGSLEAK